MMMARRRVPSSGFRPAQESAPAGQYDWGLIALFLMLLCIGLLMVLSASGVVAERINGDKYFFFKRQLIYAAAGGVVMWVLAAVPRHVLYKFQYPFLVHYIGQHIHPVHAHGHVGDGVGRGFAGYLG